MNVLGKTPDAAAYRVSVAVDGGEIVEQNTPHEFFDNPQVDRTRTFLDQILNH